MAEPVTREQAALFLRYETDAEFHHDVWLAAGLAREFEPDLDERSALLGALFALGRLR